MTDNNSTQAFFLDKEGKLYYATIDMLPTEFKEYLNDRIISITVYDINDNEVGYTRIYPEREKNGRLTFYYDVVYVYDKYRNKGIGTKINELVDYLLRNYEGHLIRGIYMPENSSTSKEEADKMTTYFHNKSGYSIITCKEYDKNKNKYPYLNEQDFVFDEFGGTTIAAKVIEEQDYEFTLHDGKLFDKRLENKKIKSLL